MCIVWRGCLRLVSPCVTAGNGSPDISQPRRKYVCLDCDDENWSSASRCKNLLGPVKTNRVKYSRIVRLRLTVAWPFLT